MLPAGDPGPTRWAFDMATNDMATKTASVERGVKLQTAHSDSFAALRGNVGLKLARQGSTAIKTSTQEKPGKPPKHVCPHTTCIANMMGCCIEAKNPRVDAKWHASSEQKTQTVPRHRMIFHPKEWHEYVPIICSGWASYSLIEINGRRQILSFRLPGDVISTAWLWQQMPERAVEAITQVTYRKFERKKFMAMLCDTSGLWERLLKALSNELAHAERIAYAVGRLRADERVARLIVCLSERLAKYGMVQGQTMEFPLRQRDVADATGLTHDHVSKVLGSFQRANLIKISDQSLTIIDQSELFSRALRPFH